MDKNETLGAACMYGGSITTGCTAQVAFMTESHVLMIFSALGALSAVCGLAYTVWNGNRNYKLQLRVAEMNLSMKALQAKESSNG